MSTCHDTPFFFVFSVLLLLQIAISNALQGKDDTWHLLLQLTSQSVYRKVSCAIKFDTISDCLYSTGVKTGTSLQYCQNSSASSRAP